MARLLKIILVVVLIPLILFLLLLLYASITDYRPSEIETVFTGGNKSDTLNDTAKFSLLIWNIGYAGLDNKMDFFYDGGHMVRTPEVQLTRNMEGIRKFLETNSADLTLLQEVDLQSHRSYGINEVEMIAGDKEMMPYMGINYNVFFVPLPFNNPMGGVKSGVVSFSRFAPLRVERVSFPGQYAWPKRLFMLDRCFLIMRYPVSSGRELLVINTHNEAYDNGSIRDQQMEYLKKFITSEYSKGNYVVVAGDWNQCPPGLIPRFKEDVFDSVDFKGIDEHYLPDNWKWVYDGKTPSNRRLDIPYTKGKTKTTVIDFALISPNIISLGCTTVDLGFENSDHQPVIIKLAMH